MWHQRWGSPCSRKTSRMSQWSKAMWNPSSWLGAGPVTIETNAGRGLPVVVRVWLTSRERAYPLSYSGEHLEGTGCFLVKESKTERDSTQGIFFLTVLESWGATWQGTRLLPSPEGDSQQGGFSVSFVFLIFCPSGSGTFLAKALLVNI